MFNLNYTTVKKLLLPILTTLIVLTSCEKEDILEPIPTNPTIPTVIDSTTNLDTIIVNGGNDTIYLLNGEEVLTVDNTINTNGTVTILPPSSQFSGYGKKYNIILAEFDMNCSELTNQSMDTSYSFTTYNQGSGTFNFDNNDTLTTTVYPLNGNASPTHSYMMGPNELPYLIRGYSYSPGILTLDLRLIFCNGTQIVDWSVDMVVTEYSNGNLDLSIDQGGAHTNSSGHISWNSHLKIVLEETN